MAGDRPQRGGPDLGAPLGDGHRDPDQPADGRGRRARGRLEPGRDRAGGRRHGLRLAEHRRLAQHSPVLRGDACGRRHRADHARAGRGADLGRPRGRVPRPQPPGRPRPERQRDRVWRARRQRPAYPDPRPLHAGVQAGGRLPLRRQAGPDHRPRRDRRRQRGLRVRRQPAGHEGRRDRSQPRAGGQAAEGRQPGGRGAARRRGGRDLADLRAPPRVQGRGRCGRDRRRHLHRVPRPRPARDRVGREPARGLRLA